MQPVATRRNKLTQDTLAAAESDLSSTPSPLP